MAIRRTRSDRRTDIEWLVDEQPVSNVSVHDLRLRIGSVPLRCGGIGKVGTKHEHRMHGYSRLVLGDAVQFMREEGYHVSALFGIPNFYDRFGFASALFECEASVATRDAELATLRFQVREFRQEDAPTVARLYEALHAGRTGSVVRDPGTWQGFRFGPRWIDRIGAFVVVDEAGAAIGYALYDLEATRCVFGEVGYTGPAVHSTLLARMAQMAVERRVERVTLMLAPDEPFLHYCRRFGCKVEVSCQRAGGGMARIIDQSGLLERLQPLFEERLRSAGLGGWQGTLVIGTDLGEDRLRFGRGGPALTLKLPQPRLTQLIFGYRSVLDVLLEPEAGADAEALPVLEALFPNGWPYTAWGDRF